MIETTPPTLTEYETRTRECALVGHVEVAWTAGGRELRHCSRCGCGLVERTP